MQDQYEANVIGGHGILGTRCPLAMHTSNDIDACDDDADDEDEMRNSVPSLLIRACSDSGRD